MDKKRAFLGGLSVAALTLIAVGVTFNIGKGTKNLTSAETNTMITLSSSNPVSSGTALTKNGSSIWFKGDSSSGVTWNNGSNKVAIAANGYIQSLSALHGIQSVTVNLVSGSLDLYHGFVEPSDLDTPMYGIDKTFSSTATYAYTGTLPNRVRLRATQDTVVTSIVIQYDCVSAESDSNVETLDYGLENSYIDSGSIGTYATTSYVTGVGNTYSKESKRALRLDFKNTTNNYVSLNTSKNKTKNLADELPDVSNAIVSFKAKYSDNINNYDMSLSAVGSDWNHSSYIKMNRGFYDKDGWYSYSLDLSNVNFGLTSEIIRINVRPDGVNTDNKSTAYVILDDIEIKKSANTLKAKYETISEGLENMSRDTGWENTYVSYDRANTFGRTSTNSLEVRPGYKSKNGTLKWFVSLSPESCSDFFETIDEDFSSGILSFNYKPIRVTNPTSVTVAFYKDWDTSKVVSLNGTYIKDGWYRYEYNLSNLGYEEGTLPIRINLGFDVDDTKLDSSKVYFDNIKIIPSGQEDMTLGLENMTRDTGWESTTVSVDRNYVASDTSTNSMKLTWNNSKTINNTNKGFVVLSPQAAGLTISGNSGILEAKFLYSSEFTVRTVRLVLVDSSWNAARYNINVSPLGNGWYYLKQDMSSLPTPVSSDSSYTGESLIRIGFGFNQLSDIDRTTATVWMDDVFYTSRENSSAASDAIIWQAYNTENILQGESVTSGRQVSESQPLVFSDLQNGTDSTQLMIRANSAISSYSFKAGTLYSDSGAQLYASDFEVLVEKYVYIGTDSAEKKGGSYGWKGAGYYPDALVPIDRIIKKNENTISANKQQGLWINVNIPATQKAGTYTGYGVLTLNGVEFNVPMEVTVYNAYLSEKNNNRSCFLTWDDHFQYGEGADRTNSQMYDAYYYFLNDRRICPGNNRWWNSGTYEEFANTFYEKIMLNDKVSTYRIPADKESYDDIYGYLNALIEKNIEVWDSGEHINFFDKAIFYLNDEPLQPQKNTSSADGKESISEWNDVKQSQTYIHNAQTALQYKLDDYPELKAGLLDVRNVLTTNVDYATITGGTYSYYGTKTYPNYFNDTYMDTPCPTFDHLNNASERASYLSTFDHLWFYGCLLPNLPYPGYHIDSTLIAQRMITWMQYSYGIEGSVYWATNYCLRKDTDTYVTPDVWTDAYTLGYSAGDGRLVYPGVTYDIYGPITSMRLENIRNSFQDYEYFLMIDAMIDEYNQTHSTAYTSCNDLLASYTANMFSGTQVTASFKSNTFNSYRTTLLSIIENLYN